MILNYPSNVKPTLSKEIAKKQDNKMSAFVKKGLGKAECRGLEDPCIKSGTVGKQLSKLIKK